MNDDAKLQATAQRLGTQAAERLNVERTVAAVIERLRAEPPRSESRWSWMQPAWLRIAATLVIVAGSGLIGRRLLVEPGTGSRHEVAHFVRDDLSDLSADQLRDVLTTLDETLDLGRTSMPEGDLEDLDAQQLRAVLRSLEG